MRDYFKNEDGWLIKLEKITRENIDEVLALKVDENQKSFVSTNGDSLAQAYVYSETAYPFAVYEDSTIVGFIMMGYYEAKAYFTLWKFMIDIRYQTTSFSGMCRNRVSSSKYYSSATAPRSQGLAYRRRTTT